MSYLLERAVQQVAERLRAAATDAARPPATFEEAQEQLLAVSRRMTALASELEHERAAERQLREREHGAPRGTDRLWRQR